MSNVRWHAYECNRMKRLLERGHDIPAIALILGKTARQVREKIRWDEMPADKREERRLRINARRNSSGEYKSTPWDDKPKSSSRATPDMIADATNRLLAPRTISQELFGDPPPGYSALDRKRQGLAQ